VDKQLHTFLAVDLGASNGRVIIGRLVGRELTLEEAHRFEHTFVERDGVKRWDWDTIIGEVRAGLRNACEATGDDPVSSVSCDAWAQDFGLLDEHGELFYPPVSYRDGRTEGMPQRFSDVIEPLALRRRVGSAILPMTTLCQLRAMAETEPEVLRRAGTLLHVADLVHHDLCGECATDWTLATASQLRNVARGEWDEELLAQLGIPAAFLPQVVDGPRVLGRIPPGKAPHRKLENVPVVIGAGHDTSAATAAITPMARGSLFLSAGTWIMMGCCTGDFFFPDDLEDASVSVLGLALGKWALFHGGMGLWLIQECRRQWRAQGTVLSYDELAEGAAISGVASRIDAADARFFTPDDMVEEIASACRDAGQEAPQCPGDYARVIFDSLAHGIRDSVAKLGDVTGITFKELRVVSGGSKDPYFCRRTAEVVGLPVLAGPSEATTIGNILMQAWGLGILSDEAALCEVVSASCPPRLFATQ